MSFSHGVFLVKVLNEAMLTQVYVSISNFSYGVFMEMQKTDYSIELVELME